MLPIFAKIVNATSIAIGKINWKTKRVLTEEERTELKSRLKKDYYIALTRHNGHLAAYAISLAHFFLDGDIGYYGHALMNLEDEVTGDGDYRFIEATGKGVHYSGFDEAFDDQTSSVALLKPKALTLREWTDVMDYAKTQLGKPYDTLFDIANANKLSCVELVRVALQIMPTYEQDFADFEARIKKGKNFDPETFRECTDFEVVWEVRH